MPSSYRCEFRIIARELEKSARDSRRIFEGFPYSGNDVPGSTLVGLKRHALCDTSPEHQRTLSKTIIDLWLFISFSCKNSTPEKTQIFTLCYFRLTTT